MGAGGSVVRLFLDAVGDLLDDEVLGPADEES